jgi:hypothetical protein
MEVQTRYAKNDRGNPAGRILSRLPAVSVDRGRERTGLQLRSLAGSIKLAASPRFGFGGHQRRLEAEWLRSTWGIEPER